MFSDGEKKRRVEAVRGLMQDEKLDVLLTIHFPQMTRKFLRKWLLQQPKNAMSSWQQMMRVTLPS